MFPDRFWTPGNFFWSSDILHRPHLSHVLCKEHPVGAGVAQNTGIHSCVLSVFISQDPPFISKVSASEMSTALWQRVWFSLSSWHVCMFIILSVHVPFNTHTHTHTHARAHTHTGAMNLFTCMHASLLQCWHWVFVFCEGLCSKIHKLNLLSCGRGNGTSEVSGYLTGDRSFWTPDLSYTDIALRLIHFPLLQCLQDTGCIQSQSGSSLAPVDSFFIFFVQILKIIFRVCVCAYVCVCECAYEFMCTMCLREPTEQKRALDLQELGFRQL